MSITTESDPATLTIARRIDEHDQLGYFAAGNLAGIADLTAVAQTALTAAREVADGLTDAELAGDPVVVAVAAAALAESEGSDAFATCDAEATNRYRSDARMMLSALA